jgi:hypothetical protein
VRRVNLLAGSVSMKTKSRVPVKATPRDQEPYGNDR